MNTRLLLSLPPVCVTVRYRLRSPPTAAAVCEITKSQVIVVLFTTTKFSTVTPPGSPGTSTKVTLSARSGRPVGYYSEVKPVPVSVIDTLDSCSPRSGETLDKVGVGPTDGEGDADGLRDADGLIDGDTELDGLIDAEGLIDGDSDELSDDDGLIDADGLRDADGLTDEELATVNVPLELKVCMV